MGYKKIGTVDKQGVFVEAKVKDGCLSICGEIHRSGHYVGGGQCVDTVRDVYQHGTLAIPYKQARKLVRIWERWHLNDMRAGCEHQRTAGWNHSIKLESDWGEGQRNMAIWMPRKEHPRGLLSEPCWVCGYKYGTSWLMEELPADVIAFVDDFNAA